MVSNSRPRRVAAGRAAALALTLLLLGACAGARALDDDREQLLLSPTPPRIADCRVEAFPAELPPVGAIVDSAALAAAVRPLAGRDDGAPGFVLLSLEFAEDGANVERRVVEHSTSRLVADSVQRLVFSHRRTAPEAEQAWGARLRVDLDAPVAIRIGRREFCPPVPRSRELRESMHRYTPVGVRFRGGRRERVVHVRIIVTASGTVASASIVAGDLRGSALERDIDFHMRQYLFDPATLDGAATRSYVQIPVRVRG